MLDLLIIVIFGALFAYFATQNSSGVDVRIAGFMLSHIPLYLLVLGSMIVGLVLASLLHYIDLLFTFLKFQQKKRTVNDLEARVKELEAENTKLKGDTIELKSEEQTHAQKYHPSVLDRIRHRLT